MTKVVKYVLLNGSLMAATSEAAKECMVNAISVGINHNANRDESW